MCDNCRGILLLSHSIDNCPLKRILYCSNCISYGHDYSKCINVCRSYPLEKEVSTKIVEDKAVIYNILDHPKAIKSFLKVFDELPDKDKYNRDKDKFKKHLKIFEKKRNVKVVLYN
jgi:hypothetical protein